MLDDIKKSYYENAEALTGWKDKSRSDLCRQYVELKENNDPLADNCLSAIIYKFWNVATHNYHSQRYKLASAEDCYDWLITGIMYVLEHHVWTDPESSLYGDENAPEKAINVKIFSEKINYYVSLRRDKRQSDVWTTSLDKVMDENDSEDYFVPTFDKHEFSGEYLDNLIKMCYDSKDYFKAFAIDIILNDNVIDVFMENGVQYSKFNRKRFKRHLNNLTDRKCREFAQKYGADLEDVKYNAQRYMDIPQNKFDEKVNRFLKDLKHDKMIMEFIRTYECGG